jgi:hypothetical protein
MQGENPGGFDRLSHPVGWILDARNWMLETGKKRIRHSTFVTRHLKFVTSKTTSPAELVEACHEQEGCKVKIRVASTGSATR